MRLERPEEAVFYYWRNKKIWPAQEFLSECRNGVVCVCLCLTERHEREGVRKNREMDEEREKAKNKERHKYYTHHLHMEFTENSRTSQVVGFIQR